MVSGACHYALQGHGVLARGIDYAASFMVVGMRLLRLQRRDTNEQKSGKGQGRRFAKQKFHLNIAFLSFMGLERCSDIPEHPEVPG